MAELARRILPWIRAVLVFVITLCILAQIWVNWVALVTWWGEDPAFPWAYAEYDDPHDAYKPALTVRYHALTDRYLDLGAGVYPLQYGSTHVNFIFFLGSVLLAALCTFALRSLPTERVSRADQMRGVHGAIRKSWLQVKKAVFFQIPPHRFWLWWCGGLNIFEAFFYLSVCGMCILGAQQLTKDLWDGIDAQVAEGTFADYYEGQSVSCAKLEGLALRSGFLIYPATMFMFFPVPRNSFIQALFGVDFSYLIKYHRWMGHLTLITTSIHGILYYVLWGIQNEFRVEFRHWQQHGISNLAGNLSYIFGLILWASSFEVIRRKYFEVFYKLHIIGFLGFYVFGFVHYDGFWYYSAPAFMLYLLDLTFRVAQWMNVSIVTGTLMSESVLALHLKFTPETKLEPNSFVFVSCPDASRAQWHPFTFSYVRNSTSPTEPAHATIYLKPYGRWVQAVIRRIVDKGAASVKIDGPYGGSNSLVQGDCQVAVIFAGGIGVTPMLGLLAALQEQRAQAEFHGSLTSPNVPDKIIFVWACRNVQEFDMLDEHILAESRNENSWLDIQLYCTGDLRTLNGSGFPAEKENGKPAPHTNGKGTDGDLSLESCTKANNEKFPPCDRPELKLASPFFLKPSLLQGYGIGYPLWALVHVLGFFGAYLCVLVGNAYGIVDGVTHEDYGVYSFRTLVELAGLVVGTMGMPALVIFPVYLWRRRNAHRAMGQAEMSWSHPNTILSSVNPQAFVQSKVEEGIHLSHSQGRPNIRTILKQAQTEHHHVPVIHVHAAGPPGMVRDIQFHCNDLNAFVKSGPHLEYNIDSFSL